MGVNELGRNTKRARVGRPRRTSYAMVVPQAADGQAGLAPTGETAQTSSRHINPFKTKDNPIIAKAEIQMGDASEQLESAVPKEELLNFQPALSEPQLIIPAVQSIEPELEDLAPDVISIDQPETQQIIPAVQVIDSPPEQIISVRQSTKTNLVLKPVLEPVIDSKTELTTPEVQSEKQLLDFQPVETEPEPKTSESDKPEHYAQIAQTARAYRQEGRCKQAEDLYNQAIAATRVAAAHYSQLDQQALVGILYELAEFYSFQGKDRQSESLWLEILELAPDTAAIENLAEVIFKLAAVYEKKGEIAEAEKLYIDFLQKRENELGKNSLEITDILKKLAASYCRQQNYAAAESLYLRTLAIEEFHLGTCTESINGTVDALIDVFEKLGKWRLAEYMLSRQKAILSVLHGENSLCVASCQLKLAKFLNETGQLNKAIDNYASVVTIYADIFGEEVKPVLSLKKTLEQLRSKMRTQSFAPDHSIDLSPTKSEPYNDPYNQVSAAHLDPGNIAAVFV